MDKDIQNKKEKTQGAQFVHLHLHTHYSLLDGMIREKALMERCLELGMPAVAITDHGNMHGVLKFYLAAKERGIKPIIGAELFLENVTDPPGLHKKYGYPFHLVLLAENQVGYENLSRLVTASNMDPAYKWPQCNRSLLEQHNEGLIALSGCILGELQRIIQRYGMKRAVEVANYYRSLFSGGRYFIELQSTGMPEQQELNQKLVEVAETLDIPLVATNDCHYLLREHGETHEILTCIRLKKTLHEIRTRRRDVHEMYVKSPDEMAAHFPDHPQALANTLIIAERCNVELPLNRTIYPQVDLPPEESPKSTLRVMAFKGLKKRMPLLLKNAAPTDPKQFRKVVKERLEHELWAICEREFAGYFLTVQDYVNHAKANGFQVGPGMGAAAGSLMNFALGITEVDPIRFDLLFERFLNSGQKERPNLVVVFSSEGRMHAFQYIADKYGDEKVARVSTFSWFSARGAIRDVGNMMGFDFNQVEYIAQLIPDYWSGSLAEAMSDRSSELSELCRELEHAFTVLKHAAILQGQCRYISSHTAGIVIADKPLVEYLPLMTGHEGEIRTQWDKEDLRRSGLIHFDLLSLRTPTLIENFRRIGKRKWHKKWDWNSIPLDDPKTYQLLCAADTTGVFQCESQGMRELLIRLQPSQFNHLVALIALYRPAPLDVGITDDFIDRKTGNKQVKYDLPQLEPLLSETYGIMIYQEQIMRVISIVSGISLGEADRIRNALSRKSGELDSFQERFIQGALDQDFPEEQAIKVWNTLSMYGFYSFTKAHAVSSALTAYWMAYLKANHPKNFMRAYEEINGALP